MLTSPFSLAYVNIYVWLDPFKSPFWLVKPRKTDILVGEITIFDHFWWFNPYFLLVKPLNHHFSWWNPRFFIFCWWKPPFLDLQLPQTPRTSTSPRATPRVAARCWPAMAQAPPRASNGWGAAETRGKPGENQGKANGETEADPKVKISPLPCWLISRAGVGRGCHLTRQDKSCIELFYGRTIKIISGKKRREETKNQKKWNDRKRHKPCKSLWLVALEMPSEIGQS